MPGNILDFEKPLVELRGKIKELQSFMEEKDLDFTDEIKRLKNRARNLQQDIYNNLDAGQIIKIARHTDRPNTLDYIDYIIDDFVELHGDRNFSDDRALVGGIGLLNDLPVTVIGHQKGESTKENLDRNFGMAHPEGYRKALRLMKQAEKFKRPVISLINTPGAYPGIGAEERGQAEAIATGIMEMSALEIPIIVVIIGEGGSGGALGIGVGDRIMMLEYGYYSVSSPEACAAILWNDSGKADEAAEALTITAPQLKELGIIDKIINEPRGGAHKDPERAARLLKKELLKALNRLRKKSTRELLAARYEKYRSMGEFKVNKLKKEINNNARTS